MPAIVLIGSQWGDEGKGKLIDVLSSQVDFVVRYQGGANAGHTLKVKQEQIIVHLVPSSIFYSQVTSVIASGVALDIVALCQEIQNLKKIGKMQDDKKFLISDSATLLLDSHKQLDQARESFAGIQKIGTTGKGIGPAYEARASRKALIFSDLFQKDSILLQKLEEQTRESSFLLSHLYKQKPLTPKDLLKQICECRALLQTYRCEDVSLVLHQALEQGKKVLFEGAQGSLLDLLHGTYPFVTSSFTLAGGALPSSGLGFKNFTKTIAVTKAYTTRVGSGPFPTECDSEAGQHLQKQGQEFGAVTGRKRRCGWLDLPALKYAIRLNGASSLALMKLDVLSYLKEIKICVAYSLNGQEIKNFSASSQNISKYQAVYQSFKGWNQDLSQITSYKDLPEEARSYISFISKSVNKPIDIISVGPKRAQSLWINKIF